MLAVGRVIAERMRVNEDKCLAAFDGEVFATDRALELVLEGVPFRDAYRQVAATLGELGTRDPKAAIAKKTHLGAPANLGLDLARGRIAAAEKMRQAARGTLRGRARRALGSGVPSARLSASRFAVRAVSLSPHYTPMVDGLRERTDRRVQRMSQRLRRRWVPSAAQPQFLRADADQ